MSKHKKKKPQDEAPIEEIDEVNDYADDDAPYANDLMEQLAEERAEKYHMIDQMTPEEYREYEREKSRRMHEFAREHGIKINVVGPKTPKDPDDTDAD